MKLPDYYELLWFFRSLLIIWWAREYQNRPQIVSPECHLIFLQVNNSRDLAKSRIEPERNLLATHVTTQHLCPSVRHLQRQAFIGIARMWSWIDVVRTMVSLPNFMIPWTVYRHGERGKRLTQANEQDKKLHTHNVLLRPKYFQSKKVCGVTTVKDGFKGNGCLLNQLHSFSRAIRKDTWETLWPWMATFASWRYSFAQRYMLPVSTFHQEVPRRWIIRKSNRKFALSNHILNPFLILCWQSIHSKVQQRHPSRLNKWKTPASCSPAKFSFHR